MYYTGVDLHRRTSYLTTVDQRGKVVARANLPNDQKAILAYFAQLPGPTRVVIEATAGWYWLHDLLVEKGIHVIISNPVKTKAIASARIKNDKLDSHMLAQLLRAELIATVYIPSIQSRALREMLRYKEQLAQDIRRTKNRIHSLLIKNNLHVPYSNLLGLKAIDYLHNLQLPHHHRLYLDNHLQLYQQINQRLQLITKDIHQMAKEHPIAQLLMTIPGVGPFVAMVLIALIDDINRFPSYRHLASYAGLVPCLNASGSTQRKGRITKAGPAMLRTALVEAAQAVARSRPNKLNLFFRRIIVRSGYRKATVATAHKILQVAYYVWKNQTPYQEQLQSPRV